MVCGKHRVRVTTGRYRDLSLSAARGEAKKLLSTAPEPKQAPRTFAEARATFLGALSRQGTARKVQRDQAA